MADMGWLQDPQFRETVEHNRIINKLKKADADPNLVEFQHDDYLCKVQRWPARHIAPKGKFSIDIAHELACRWPHLQYLEMAVWVKLPFDLKFEFLSLRRHTTSFQIRTKTAWSNMTASPQDMKQWYSSCGLVYEIVNRTSDITSNSVRTLESWHHTFRVAVGEDSSGMYVTLMEIEMNNTGITQLHFSTSNWYRA